MLILLAAASALGIVSAQNEARKLYAALEHEQARTESLDKELQRLQIEQEHLSALDRVENIARHRLGMVLPEPGQIIALEKRP
ncbi:MAG: cell division protein FtsL [Azoarcus sp.]|nr:cell division protein FtsL [Azoarcus sp.]